MVKGGKQMDNMNIYKQLMKRRSFRESTPITREIKLKRAVAYRQKKIKLKPFI